LAKVPILQGEEKTSGAIRGKIPVFGVFLTQDPAAKISDG